MAKYVSILLLLLILCGCSYVSDSKKIISEYQKQNGIEGDVNYTFEVIACKRRDWGENDECISDKAMGQSDTPACKEDTRLQKCDFIVEVTGRSCYFPTKGVRDCTNNECKYYFSKYGMGVCN